MTYYELWQDAIRKLDNNEITLGEYEKMITPLHREVDTLDKIRAEIETLPRELPTDSRNMVRRTRVLDIIDKYRKSEVGSEVRE